MALQVFRVGLVQMACGPEPEENLAKALDRIGEAAGRGAQVVCLPELFRLRNRCVRAASVLGEFIADCRF